MLDTFKGGKKNRTCAWLDHVVLPLGVPGATALAQFFANRPPFPFVHRSVELGLDLKSVCGAIEFFLPYKYGCVRVEESTASARKKKLPM